MLKLKSYLKPFIWGFIISILLLFVQAASDLNLPNYMSDIVNVGIQQNGIEKAAPDVLSKDGYEFLTGLLSDDDAVLYQTSYELKSTNEKDRNGKQINKEYPLADSEVYVLKKDINDEELTRLNATVGEAVWTIVQIMKTDSADMQVALPEKMSQTTFDFFAQNSPELEAAFSMLYTVEDEIYVLNSQAPVELKTQIETALTQMVSSMFTGNEGQGTASLELSSVDITELYNIMPVLAILSDDTMAEARSSAQSMDSSLLTQSGTMITAAFYEELGVNMTSYQSAYIIKVGLIMLLIALIGGISTIIVSYLSSRIAAGVAKNLRGDIFKKIQTFSNAEFDKFSTASLITRSTNDVMQVQMLLTMGIRMICYAPIMAIGGIVMALGKSVSMGWIIAVACVALLGVIFVIFAVVVPKFKVLQKLIDKLNLIARETLNGLMVIRAFGTRKFEEERFDDANKNLAKTNLFVNRAMTFMMPAMMLIMNGVSLAIIWVGAGYVADSAIQVGDMMAFMQYAMQIIMSFLMIAMMFVFLPRAAVSANRIAEVLNTVPAINDPKNPKNTTEKGLVEFRNVSFRYEGADEDVLKNISFTAHPGETTAFIGATGSGKSTLINLIPRFYDATQGEVLVDGVNVKELNQEDLRSHIGYVPQKSVLLSGTIKSNILYGNENATDEQLVKATEIAQSLDFVSEKDGKFESQIAQGGTNVSGGQRQRLSIARALAVNPDIYIFDDSFSALDFKTDAALRKALKENIKDGTILIVAQRVSTIMDANKIFVIDDGEIVGSGTHKELLKTCPEYYEIASSQLSKEELENE